ncbi:hypothetical protein ACS0TY_012957 [Phlomoides rotata]
MQMDFIRHTTSFFFTNFPDSWGSKDLWCIFRKYGNIRDVSIPSKRNKEGKKFGFARFGNVYDPVSFAKTLDSIWIGSFKLGVNQPRFGSSYKVVRNVLDVHQNPNY